MGHPQYHPLHVSVKNDHLQKDFFIPTSSETTITVSQIYHYTLYFMSSTNICIKSIKSYLKLFTDIWLMPHIYT
jgi:hypothetical protein